MKVDKALILAAGAGTRMGEIGKHVPKVLWPVFEKTILELEVKYAMELGAKEIFVNTYNYADKILEFTKNNKTFEKVHVLEEHDAIDIGGAIHNLCHNYGYTGNLLVLNSDQFIFISPELWQRVWEKFEANDVLMFSYDVKAEEKYNAIKTDGDNFVGVIPYTEFNKGTVFSTYTGMSLIKLESLEGTPGRSQFFHSVANPDKRRVVCQNIEESPYWDFGTLFRFWNSYYNLLEVQAKGGKDLFLDFLIRNNAFDPKKAGATNYNSDSEGVINLTEVKVDTKNKIIFGSSPEQECLELNDSGILFGDILEKNIL